MYGTTGRQELLVVAGVSAAACHIDDGAVMKPATAVYVPGFYLNQLEIH